VHLEAQMLACASILKKKGKFVPDLIMAGGFVNETQMYKSIAMSNVGGAPLVKGIAMARAPILAAMKSQYFARQAAEGKLAKSFTDEYGAEPDKFFIQAQDLMKEYPGKKLGKDIPWGAVGLYTYYDRLAIGLRQMMAGYRKFSLEVLDRSDIMSLTPYAAKVTGIPTIDEMAEKVMPGILEFWDE
jgi:hypothetical protein